MDRENDRHREIVTHLSEIHEWLDKIFRYTSVISIITILAFSFPFILYYAWTQYSYVYGTMIIRVANYGIIIVMGVGVNMLSVEMILDRLNEEDASPNYVVKHVKKTCLVVSLVSAVLVVLLWIVDFESLLIIDSSISALLESTRYLLIGLFIGTLSAYLHITIRTKL